MRIQKLDDRQEKQRVSRAILEALPEWFGIPETRENYIRESADEIMLVFTEGGNTKGFLCLKKTGKDTLELAVMEVYGSLALFSHIRRATSIRPQI